MFLDLQFSSVMQAWGVREEWYFRRRTATYPDKSAIVGLIGRAMGIDRDDEEGQLALRNEIRGVVPVDVPLLDRATDDETTYIGDYLETGLAKGFPSACGGLRTVSGKVVSQMFSKDYLIDSLSKPVVVAVEGDKEFLETVREALLHPKYPPYLGRYCCIPAKPIVKDGVVYETLRPGT